MAVSKKTGYKASITRIKFENVIKNKDELKMRTVNDQLSNAEVELLFSLADGISEGRSIVCAGNGEAIHWLTKGLVSGKVEKIFHINPANKDKATDGADISIEYPNVFTQEGLPDTLVRSFRTPEEASRRCKGKIGLIWIGKSNSYEAIKRTLLAWQPKLALDAKVVFHHCDLPAPARVLKEYLGDLGDFTLSESIGTITVVNLDKCVHHWMIDSNDIGTCKNCNRKRNYKRIRKGVQWVESTETEDLQTDKKVMDQKEQSVSKKKKVIKHRRGWNG